MGRKFKPKIGLALGSGAARGWAHIGVIQALTAAGAAPEVVCGTSIGALVGAAYAAGDLERLADWVLGLRWRDVVGYLDVSLNGGLIKGDKLMAFLRHQVTDTAIAKLTCPFAAVATDLYSGREVWLREGAVMDAVRASLALPGLFSPVARGARLLVDGGLVNPVPVSLCQAMGADVVIAVDLSSDLLGRHWRPQDSGETVDGRAAAGGMLDRIQSSLWRFGNAAHSEKERAAIPSVLQVLAGSITIMQVRITRSRLAGEPADVLIAPRLASTGLMDFHRGGVAIKEGRRAAEAALPALREWLDGVS
ncbi:MAG TPA: patatin [Betaproteobacteria bacterium]|nr:patatin [Betaproteobacteria bacterium]